MNKTHKRDTENTQGRDSISKWMPFLYFFFKAKSNVKNSFNSPYSKLDIFQMSSH